jgi:transformation/transcription domain-associated protein
MRMFNPRRKMGDLAFDANEYELWKNEWISCAKTLQQWDILHDLGNFMGDCSLSIEASWRSTNFLIESDRTGFAGLVSLKKDSLDKRFYEMFSGLFDEYRESNVMDGD